MFLLNNRYCFFLGPRKIASHDIVPVGLGHVKMKDQILKIEGQTLMEEKDKVEQVCHLKKTG